MSKYTNLRDYIIEELGFLGIDKRNNYHVNRYFNRLRRACYYIEKSVDEGDFGTAEIWADDIYFASSYLVDELKFAKQISDDEIEELRAVIKYFSQRELAAIEAAKKKSAKSRKK